MARLKGDSGENTLNATNLNDGIFAGGGDDVLRGYGGHDFLMGQRGDDFIVGGKQSDKMWGDSNNPNAEGADTFYFRQGDGWHDRIMDFEAIDRIELGGSIDSWSFNGIATSNDGTTGLLLRYYEGETISGSIILSGLSEADSAWAADGIFIV